MIDGLKYVIAALAVVFLLIFSSQVYAAPSGASVDEQGQETYTAPVGTADTEGGNVSEVNISGNQQTTRWAGFFGNISGGLVLKDASGDSFYEWTVSDMSGSIVYAANETVTDWGTLAAASQANMYSFLMQGSNDDYNSTFDTERTATFNGGAITANSTTTWNGTQVAGHLVTYSLLADVSTLIWANVANASYSGFEGTTLDYQILVPVEALGNTMTYNFYLEIP